MYAIKLNGEVYATFETVDEAYAYLDRWLLREYRRGEASVVPFQAE